jgi:hypothetical protein
MKVLHVMSDHAYKRVFASFKQVSGIQQTIAAPPPLPTTRAVTETYADCGLKDVRIFRNPQELQHIVSKIQPNIYTQADLSVLHSKMRLPAGCKRAMFHHGMLAMKTPHVTEILGLAEDSHKKWKVFDLFFGDTIKYKYWLNRIGINDNSKIILDTLTQLDVVYDNIKYCNKFRDSTIRLSGVKNPNKIVLFFGSRVGDRFDYKPFSIDYFDTLFTLHDLAVKNNWLILVKPKWSFKKIINILKSLEKEFPWAREYAQKYASMQNKKNILYITTNSHPYGYFFSDVIVTSGSGSTLELEAAVAKKPIVIYRPDKEGFTDFFWSDPYHSIRNGAAFWAKSKNDIETCIEMADSVSITDAQDSYIKNMGITNDGKAYIRALDAMRRAL